MLCALLRCPPSKKTSILHFLRKLPLLTGPQNRAWLSPVRLYWLVVWLLSPKNQLVHVQSLWPPNICFISLLGWDGSPWMLWVLCRGLLGVIYTISIVYLHQTYQLGGHDKFHLWSWVWRHLWSRPPWAEDVLAHDKATPRETFLPPLPLWRHLLLMVGLKKQKDRPVTWPVSNESPLPRHCAELKINTL